MTYDFGSSHHLWIFCDLIRRSWPSMNAGWQASLQETCKESRILKVHTEQSRQIGCKCHPCRFWLLQESVYFFFGKMKEEGNTLAFVGWVLVVDSECVEVALVAIAGGRGACWNKLWWGHTAKVVAWCAPPALIFGTRLQGFIESKLKHRRGVSFGNNGWGCIGGSGQ